MPVEKPELIPKMNPMDLAFLLKAKYLPEFADNIKKSAESIVQSESPEAAVFALSAFYKIIVAWEVSAEATEIIKKRIDPEI